MDDQAPAVVEQPQPDSQPVPQPDDVPVPIRKLTNEQWDAIQYDCCVRQPPLSFTEAGRKHGVSEKTISKRANRKHWPIPRILARAVGANVDAIVEKSVTKWAKRGEEHRDVAFNLAHESLKKMKPKAPKNFREAEAADKIARRAAGLETADVVQQTLIQINDAIDNHVTSMDEPDPSPEPVEAELVTEGTPSEQPQ